MCPIVGNPGKQGHTSIVFTNMNRIYLLIATLCLLAISHTGGHATNGSNKETERHLRFSGIDVDSLVISICKEEGTARIGGIWTATTDGATVGIVPAYAWQKTTGMTIPDKNRTLAEQWVMILLDSPDPILQPGTMMGWFSPTAKPGHYNATIYTKRKKTKLNAPRRFILRLADDGHLTMTAIHKGIEINPWRLLPYMIRGTVKYRDNTPRDLDGFIKKWPTPRNPQNPRYL